MTNDATLAQIAAARPEVSTWLSANAGSGKTRVLTDRVARLLLNRVQPQNILCLTYTKAAASEMQNRLFSRLGAWAMTPDDALRHDLAELGEAADLSADRLALARQLFARAIETPGGLRIQTIHSFCATLLRRYPLEAGISPGFREMDDRTARQMKDDILQEMADRLAPTELADLAGLHPAEGLEPLLAEITSRADGFVTGASGAQMRESFGLAGDETAERILAEVFLGDEADILADLIPRLAASGVNDQKAGAKLQAALPLAPGMAALMVLEEIFLNKSGAAPGMAKLGKFPAKDARAAMGPHLPRLEALMQRVEVARPRRLALAAVEKTLVLHRFAQRFLEIYTARKAERGLLDFDDLIQKAARLLNDPALAAWVLFRLDGGIDHILVDEAQDTSPPQWQVIERLTAEFTAGASARADHRTLFVVGDKKQSIYSFQGADLTAFDARHAGFRAAFAEVDQPMQDRSLDHSFRSARAVLEVVDATFGDAFPSALGAPPRHIAFFDTLPGRVDLWPLIPPAEKPKDEDGWNPVDLVVDDHHSVELARQIAREIRTMIETGTRIVEKGQPRAVHAGDFLILVQRRSDLFAQIIRACKQEGLPIAGADRLKLGEEIAVKDLKALLAFLATPEDSLSLAAALRSPLFGWSEDRLFRLAHGRAGHLWEALRHADAPETLAVLDDLRRQTDFLRPYELLERILTRHGGRQRLLTRLGPEAEDGIDELLTQAIVYEQADVPSLTGFLVWLEGDEVEVKRQLGGEGDKIRVMTVHGAKGLEANIVILPDTADRRMRERDATLRLDNGIVAWKTPADESPPALQAARDALRERAREENLRLLYVALTRARSWLIVAGAGEAVTATKSGPKPRVEWCWYRQVEAGMMSLGARADAAGRLRHDNGSWPEPGLAEVAETPAVTLPEWVALPAPDVPRAEPFLSPSDLGGAKALPGEGDDVETALLRGTLVHMLLEHLPASAPDDWPAMARAITPAGFDAPSLLAEAAGVLADARLAHLFHPEGFSEVSLAADWNGRRLVGTIDRLIVGPDRVLAVDFKTNRVIPAGPSNVPEGILRQMGAYAHMLGQIYPGRQIQTAILWTAGPSLMSLDPDIVTAALGRATIA
jgi:ATP-dependent helicase/nuclease subunit A